MTNRELIVVPECNDDNEQPCCWGMLVGKSYAVSDEHGKPSISHYLWISKYSDNEYIIEDSNGNNLTDGRTYKTLSGAKKQALQIARRQEESGCFTD